MDLKKFFNHLNHRHTRLLPKNTIFIKLTLLIVISFAVISPIKKLLARPIEGITTNTGTRGSITVSNETIEGLKAEEEAMHPDKMNQQNWVTGSFITNTMLPIHTIGGTNISTAFEPNSSWTAGGLLGATNQATASLFNPPISGTQYIANSINNFLGKPTYAASGGSFNDLKGILPIWRICRNTVYVLFSIVFIVMGLLIMLRIKISPQATVTIQNSIPKIIITLILVTFSYAIIGLIIDLTYLIQALLISLLVNNDPLGTFEKTYIPNLIKGNNVVWPLMWKALSGFTTGDALTVSLLSGIVTAIIGLIAFLSPWGLFAFLIGAAISLIFILIQFIKFFFGCVKAYIILLIKIISAPLEIALGAFPNSKIGFGSWFIQTLAYALVFPICIIFLVFLNIIINTVSFEQVWVPGFIQSNSHGLNIIAPLLGVVGLMILAKLPELIPEAIFQIKPSPFGKAIGQNMFTGMLNTAKGGLVFAANQQISHRLTGGIKEAKDKYKTWGKARADKKASKRGEGSSREQIEEQTVTPGTGAGEGQTPTNLR